MTLARQSQYIVSIMEKRNRYVPRPKLLLLAGIVLMLCLPMFAGTSLHDAYGAAIEAGWYGSIPSAFHEDDLPVRSHATFGGSITPTVLGVGSSQEFSAGITAYFTTRSLMYGVTVWRPFFAAGAIIEYTFHLDDRFSLTPALSLMAGMYTQTLEFHPILRASLIGGYEFASTPKRSRWILIMPISVDLRTDYVSVSAGAGVQWRHERKQKEDGGSK